MEITKIEKQILNYLDKEYHVVNGIFIYKPLNSHEWGINIINSLNVIFGYDLDICELVFTRWATLHGLDDAKFYDALQPRALKIELSSELAQDVSVLFGIDTEANLMGLLTEELAKEIDVQILRELRTSIKTSDEYLNIIKCLGYELTPTMFNPETFVPMKKFISMNYTLVKNERQINPHWQNWIRTRKQDKKT